MKYGKLLLALAAGFAAVKLFCKRKDTGEISLENIRKGIANGWYTAQVYSAELDNGESHFYVVLTGKDTNGNEEQSTNEITYDTFRALLDDGVDIMLG